MSLGTRSRAMTATAPACSAILACAGVTTSMMTPPLSISARPALTVKVDVSMIKRGNRGFIKIIGVEFSVIRPGNNRLRIFLGES